MIVIAFHLEGNKLKMTQYLGHKIFNKLYKYNKISNIFIWDTEIKIPQQIPVML
jgi:hypothetical protein